MGKFEEAKLIEGMKFRLTSVSILLEQL
jgi:hypothetical protein